MLNLLDSLSEIDLNMEGRVNPELGLLQDLPEEDPDRDCGGIPWGGIASFTGGVATLAGLALSPEVTIPVGLLAIGGSSAGFGLEATQS